MTSYDTWFFFKAYIGYLQTWPQLWSTRGRDTCTLVVKIIQCMQNKQLNNNDFSLYYQLNIEFFHCTIQRGQIFENLNTIHIDFVL